MEVPASEKEWISLISTSKTPLHAIQERNEKIKESEEKEREIPI
jgi:predicted DNA-binding transcriptional regulator